MDTTPTEEVDLKSKTVCCVDNGIFVEWAIKLAEDFGRVLYWSPWVDAFPRSNSMLIGDGIPEITRIKNFWEYVDAVDLFVFPDVYYADWQADLVARGKRVWGSRYGDELELNRWQTKKLMQRIGLPVQHIARIEGLTKLCEYLKKNENKWIKISATRGDFETFKHDDYALSEPKLKELGHRLGAKAEIMSFLVEDDLPDRCEIGYDGICIDGAFPPTAMQGYEIKDLGLVGRVKKYEELSEPVKFVNSKLAHILENYGYRGFFSSEIRYGRDKIPYLIDPCMRAASPPSELYMEMFDNWGEVMWAGAAGQIVDLNPVAEFGVEIMIHSSWADANWQAIHFPDEIRSFVKLRNLTKIDGQYYVVPQEVGLPEVGAVVGIGDTLDDAIEMAKEHCAQVKGYFIECKTESIDEALNQIKKGEEFGIEF